MRVLVALSGGVDSSVAAARLVDAGHDVTGVHLALSAGPRAAGGSGTSGGSGGRGRGCCTAEDSRDASRTADVLGVPFYVWDFSARFTATVVDAFVADYAAGRTPNPCVTCNQEVKFAALLDRALALGFDAVATGHYARLEATAGGGVALHRAADAAKDQSYVLAVLPPHRLARALFPLGDATKAGVRAEAAARGLTVAAKPDSTDICFVPDGDTRTWLGQRIERRPGVVLDTSGTAVGSHDGAAGFTVGQRRGLHLGAPAADGRPRYVVATDTAAGTVTVGGAQELLVDVVAGGPPTWCGPARHPGDRVGVQLRAHGAELPAVVVDGPGLRVRLDQPSAAVAPGQLMALYDGTRVVGSSTVEAAWRAGSSRAPKAAVPARRPAPAAGTAR